MELTRTELMQEIKKLLRQATEAELDLVWRFVRSLVA